MSGVDYYRIPAGDELNLLVHKKLFPHKAPGNCLQYSEDEAAAQVALRQLKSKIDSTIVTGKLRSSRRARYFARYGADPSTSTEVLAETLPLAICRLIALRLRDRSSEGIS